MILPLEDLQKILGSSSLEVFLHAHWGAASTNHRQQMRQFLVHHFHGENSPETLQHLLDLEKVPHLTGTHLSISHSLNVGTIAIAKEPVGIDVESTARVVHRAMARMSTTAEMNQAPSVASLWVAKEAAYKALISFRQPEVLSQIEIGNWGKSDSRFETFELTNHTSFHAPSGMGVVIHDDFHSLAIFLFHA